MTLCLVNQKIKIEVNISTMHKPRIFINIHYLEIGGAETSLIGLLMAPSPSPCRGSSAARRWADMWWGIDCGRKMRNNI